MFLKRTEIRKAVVEGRGEGKSDQEIYDEITMNHKNRDEVASVISRTVRDELKKKFSSHNNALLFLIIVTILLKFFVIIQIGEISNLFLGLVIGILVSILNLFVFHTVYLWQAANYRNWAILILVLSIRLVFEFEIRVDYFLSLFLTLSISVLLVYLHEKLLPNFVKNVPKDEQGNHVFIVIKENQQEASKLDVDKVSAFRNTYATKTVGQLEEIASENSSYTLEAKEAANQLLSSKFS